jgi:glutathione synthase/RimK-type ligase-like ATP-grasp enzyme
LLLKKYQKLFPDDYDFIPRSYILPEEYRKFKKYFDSNKDKHFVIKPSKGKGGDGIFFVK